MSHPVESHCKPTEGPPTGSQPTICSSLEAPSGLVFDEHQRIADWCASLMPHFYGWGSEPRGIGLEVAGTLRAGVIYTNYSGGNVFASIAIEGRMNEKFLHAIFYNPFIAWGVRHIGCSIDEDNTKSLKLCSHLGFTECGRLRQAAFNGEDIIIMGMLKHECRWL